ncbi:response regulator transcription factor [Rhodococcus sp. ABRD24]|uniref:response regulator transcription factor n=1 Tax=Rhodococcus sp. ABRD24 TaxID=2507582 RepID=UPI00103E4459|nr:response regulator transcription factor [Rhodococcus sp. ABRD24]QBJ96286.1 response regulator transcription factor [Rhodococcus sp. ABRD24]
MSSVLLIEDDDNLRDAFTLALSRYGHEVIATPSGESGLTALSAGAFDIVVLDVMLPGVDGFEVCRRIRSDSLVPIVMLTARSEDIDVVSGLETGADDYVIKPVQPRILDARIKAVLRRAATVPELPSTREVHGDLVIDRDSLTISEGDRQPELTRTEWLLLLALSTRPGQVFSREQLLESVWGFDHLGGSRLVDACVQRLRAKIEKDPSSPRYVQTVRGFGYRFGPVS